MRHFRTVLSVGLGFAISYVMIVENEESQSYEYSRGGRPKETGDGVGIRTLSLPNDRQAQCPGKQPLQVYLHPVDADDHFFRDGLTRSPCFEISKNVLTPVWIINRVRTTRGDIEKDMMDRLIQTCGNETLRNGAKCELKEKWKIFHVDYSDKPRFMGCQEAILSNHISPASAHNVVIEYYKRSIVEERTEQSQGKLAKYEKPVHHVPFGVRNDIVEVVNEYISRLHKVSPQKNLGASIMEPLNPVFIDRPGGARCFWFDTLNDRAWKKGHRRSKVAETLLTMSNLTEQKIKVGLAGKKNKKGRSEAQVDYVREMLHFKITVVTQPDKWEGHYRLMEAFAGGGLVMTEPMLAPPRHLVDGKHYVIYQSQEDLQKKVLYYLANDDERLRIAENGWKTAMSHYRSWHLMEAIILRTEDMV